MYRSVPTPVQALPSSPLLHVTVFRLRPYFNTERLKELLKRVKLVPECIFFQRQMSRSLKKMSRLGYFGTKKKRMASLYTSPPPPVPHPPPTTLPHVTVFRLLTRSSRGGVGWVSENRTPPQSLTPWARPSETGHVCAVHSRRSVGRGVVWR